MPRLMIPKNTTVTFAVPSTGVRNHFYSFLQKNGLCKKKGGEQHTVRINATNLRNGIFWEKKTSNTASHGLGAQKWWEQLAFKLPVRGPRNVTLQQEGQRWGRSQRDSEAVCHGNGPLGPCPGLLCRTRRRIAVHLQMGCPHTISGCIFWWYSAKTLLRGSPNFRSIAGDKIIIVVAYVCKALPSPTRKATGNDKNEWMICYSRFLSSL